ncbi:hypothetical protein PHMEG_00019914 [Phytophthora megakarya]|uniref:Uncharacterized protein n=1 Tax=Phytophthora megakarya TaxID=4795 RepID=A0A225VQS1_9STRA|nr:hypothetical protein PHMEG_00019914 [Phytophthora megakarya]
MKDCIKRAHAIVPTKSTLPSSPCWIISTRTSEAGQNIVAEETSAFVCPVPANSTSKRCSRLEPPNKSRTAKQKRLGVVMRTIRVWEDISGECVVKIFEKVITKEPEVMM